MMLMIGEKIQDHPPGGVGILYKKSFAGSITHIKSTNRRICGINLRIDHLSIIILSVYMPCDKKCLSVNSEYTICIDYIELGRLIITQPLVELMHRLSVYAILWIETN